MMATIWILLLEIIIYLLTKLEIANETQYNNIKNDLIKIFSLKFCILNLYTRSFNSKVYLLNYIIILWSSSWIFLNVGESGISSKNTRNDQNLVFAGAIMLCPIQKFLKVRGGLVQALWLGKQISRGFLSDICFRWNFVYFFFDCQKNTKTVHRLRSWVRD